MKHRDRDHWSRRGGDEDLLVALKGQLDETGEMQRFWNAQGGSGGAQAEKDFVGCGKHKPAIGQVADIGRNVSLVAEKRADLGWTANRGVAEPSGKISDALDFTGISSRGALSPANFG